MLAAEAMERVREKLVPLANRSGGVLISGIDTLVPGAFYVMGLNPGGDPDPRPGNGPPAAETISASLEARSEKSNSWTDCPYSAGPLFSVLQQRIKTMFRALAISPKETFCTNAISPRSKDASGVPDAWPVWWEYCWPAHQIFLSIVRPRVIICLGNVEGHSPWHMLRNPKPRLPGTRNLQPIWLGSDEPSSHGKWREEVAFDLGDLGSHSCAVLGLPHPSGRNASGWPLH